LKNACFQPNNKTITVEEVENTDVGEHEDDDVRTERQKVADVLSNRSVNPPVVIVQVIHESVILKCSPVVLMLVKK
jgi:ATP-binding cassette subfamily A (ABC1) protein 5